MQYPCAVPATDVPSDFGATSGPQSDASFWDSAEQYPPWEFRQYRTDPCHPAYYMD